MQQKTNHVYIMKGVVGDFCHRKNYDRKLLTEKEIN